MSSSVNIICSINMEITMLIIVHQSIPWIIIFSFVAIWCIPISFIFGIGYEHCLFLLYKICLQIEFYGDFDGSFHKSLELVTDLSGALLGTRSERYIIYPPWTFVWYWSMRKLAFFRYFKTRPYTKMLWPQVHCLRN